MSIDTELSLKLTEALTVMETDAKAKLPGALPRDQYNQACGFIEAIRQIRENLIPEIVEELQRS